MLKVNINKKLSLLTSAFQAARLPDTWQHLEPCDVLLVRHDGDCGYSFKEKAYAPLLDSIGDMCLAHGLYTRSVATPYSILTNIHAYNSPVSYNRASLIILLLSMMIRFIRGRARGIEWANGRQAFLWCRILEKAKPRYVIGIQPNVGLCRAGKMKGVYVYDLQHGVIADGNPWYGEKERVDTPRRDLPDGFLCWDEVSAATLYKWAPRKGIKVKILGNPWFLRFLYPDPNDLLVQEALNVGRIYRNNRPVIMVSLLWGMDYFYKYSAFNGVMVDSLEKVILETAAYYNWLIRLHPVQIRGLERETTQGYLRRTFGHIESVEFRMCSDLALPVVLQQVDLHITDSSSVVIEAAWAGIRSALLNVRYGPGGSREKVFARERSLGMAEMLPQNADVIKQWIANTLAKGKCEPRFMHTRKALRKFIDEIAADAETKFEYSI